MNVVLALLDWLLMVVHVLVVLANLLLWIPPAWRRWHLWVVAATCVSWFGLGLFYGMGYCLLTDWHWKLRVARGVHVAPQSFIHHVLVDGLGIPLAQSAVDTLTAVAFACVVSASLALNVRDSLSAAPRKL